MAKWYHGLYNCHTLIIYLVGGADYPSDKINSRRVVTNLNLEYVSEVNYKVDGRLKPMKPVDFPRSLSKLVRKQEEELRSPTCSTLHQLPL